MGSWHFSDLGIGAEEEHFGLVKKDDAVRELLASRMSCVTTTLSQVELRLEPLIRSPSTGP